MVQEGASVMVRFGPHWCNCKITWANIVNAVLNFGTKGVIVLPILNMVGAVKKTLAQQELDLSQFGTSLKCYQKPWYLCKIASMIVCKMFFWEISKFSKSTIQIQKVDSS